MAHINTAGRVMKAFALSWCPPPLVWLFFVLSLYEFSIVFQHLSNTKPDTSRPSSGDLHVLHVPLKDPCSVEHWQQELALEDPMLENVKPEDLGFFHVTFKIQGNGDGDARDNKKKKDLLVNRSKEMETSVACLQKALPDIPYQHFDLGDYKSFHSGISAFHSWAVTNSPYAANFVIDTDLLANVNSTQVTPAVMAWAFENVDMAISYDSDRVLSNLQDQHGVHSALFGYRNNKRMKLFHTCVAHTMNLAERLRFKLRQQAAMTKVLRSPVGQFIRVRWLPPEFFCSLRQMPMEKAYLSEQFLLNNVTYYKKKHMKDRQCMFVHSHVVASQGREAVPQCFDDIGSSGVNISGRDSEVRVT